jgi:ADP-ribose pyrophosphatase YjhB (NUDIX family)
VSEPVDVRHLLRWSEALAAVAKTGIGFTTSIFERERYEEILEIAGDIAAKANRALNPPPLSEPGAGGPGDFSQIDAAGGDVGFVDAGVIDAAVASWLSDVGRGVAGYVTPRLAIGAVVGNASGEILLVQRRDSGVWLYPTGWADVGYSAAEVAVKEVLEETGVTVEPVRLILLLDALRLGASRSPIYSLVFHCRPVDAEAELRPHPLECSAAGWFSRDALPSPLAGAQRWVEQAFAAISGAPVEVSFDPPRSPIWEQPPEAPSPG